MELVEYHKLSKLEETYWWHRGKLFLVDSLVKHLFPQKRGLEIMEIGCGTGHITKHLSKFGKVTGIEISKEAASHCIEKGIRNVLNKDVNEMRIPKSFEKRFDLILALDVLEHIQDDTKTMRRTYKMLKPGGFFLVNVPAHKFLWSEHDEALHHKRRYSTTEILKKLTDNDFEIIKKSFFVSTFFPAILAFRTFTNIFTKSTYPKTSYILLPKPVNDLMTKILELETKVLNFTNLPIGTTITVIARKPTGEKL
ncbi:hypothetical protein A2716_03605 [candidate division WWE3 bacterium RIFCSPHIGHO2_01_FULL_40_23]|uniref:Methyltransferase type 11 domain-containing protein n=1 Tax=candidate division WWE3 bacterium RIFCSPLOWO2_01_FULL_41_18 TaxID=1802625 RepID=A0A1F4VCN6_UNCKA|nr:MAG: hypothetical protein A2716_03605 [candidate division WWE3 bacterium RIFCSPHIGHO2_01_FULL_40_23]OGC54965.1 MAG: hypothetical protein A3A78_03215 [candidate division WWE3 bacterium RIFCSPLOWO2_01_FULL_41_18]